MAEREDAVQTALRALRFRDRTSAELAARLERRGVGEAEREQALETLERIGYVDDARFARSRAEQLEEALAELEPERERAAAIVAARGRSPQTARYLASRGFGEEALEWVVAQDG